jgi:hypothetical protein
LDPYLGAIRWGPKPRVIEGDLLRGIDRRVWPHSAGPVQFIYIGSNFIKGDTPGLAGAIGEDDDVLWHAAPPRVRVPASMRVPITSEQTARRIPLAKKRKNRAVNKHHGGEAGV